MATYVALSVREDKESPLHADTPHKSVTQPLLTEQGIPATPNSHIGSTPTFAYSDSTASRGASREAIVPSGSRCLYVCEDDRHKQSGASCHVVVNAILESTFLMTLTTLLTVWTLIGSDLQLMYTEKSSDPYFDYGVWGAFIVFSVEFILQCIGKTDYLCGFFFWLDFISTGSLLLDVSSIKKALAGGAGLSSLRAGKSARLGARAARVVRVIRLVRIVRLFKVASEMNQQQDQQSAKEKMMNWGVEEDEEEEEIDDVVESRIGSKLTEMTTRHIILLVFALLLGLPILEAHETTLMPASATYGADVVWRAFEQMRKGSHPSSRDAYQSALLHFLFYHNWFATGGYCRHADLCADQFKSQVFWLGVMGDDKDTVASLAEIAKLDPKAVQDWKKELLLEDSDAVYSLGSMPPEAWRMLSSPWNVSCKNDRNEYRLGLSLLQFGPPGGQMGMCPEDLRDDEWEDYSPAVISGKVYHQGRLVFIFDKRAFVHKESLMNLGTTGLVCVVLCVASLALSNDVTSMVLHPIEKMMEHVVELRRDPTKAIDIARKEFEQAEKRKAKAASDAGKSCLCLRGSSEEEASMETIVLEKTITKMAHLLTLGLGQAGVGLIGETLQGASKGESLDLNAMPASRIECVLCTMEIKDFAVLTQVLHARVIPFVTRIIEIVHGIVYEFHGSPNRNNGDTYLLVWRLLDIEYEHLATQEQRAERTQVCDMSLVACAKILSAVLQCPQLGEYSLHPGIQQNLGNDFHVGLAFGLHAGWAIEGTVGSDFKIDASYYSPNVAVTFNVAAATRLYRVPILATDALVGMCSYEMSQLFRHVDRVLIDGSAAPLKLYSLDLDTTSLDTSRRKIISNGVEQKPMKITSRQIFEARYSMDEKKETARTKSMASYILEDNGIKVMRSKYTHRFTHCFKMGLLNFLDSEWEAARKKLESTQSDAGFRDGPSMVLLQHMREHNFVAPKTWNGVRKISGDALKDGAGTKIVEASARKRASMK
eukprot:TRINITY_DN74925_c0_g1_i1.p1 TRINITY_DN74925_c0_g1~~TRINITY_DN74925_c0_g1_i1.p1  ORF type:complete len:1024 (+),score=190.53 TRINITY_DN74925_c0_g1_i1:92-3073(+)